MCIGSSSFQHLSPVESYKDHCTLLFLKSTEKPPPESTNTFFNSLKRLTSSHEWHTVGCVCVCACTSIGYNAGVCMCASKHFISSKTGKHGMCWTFGVFRLRVLVHVSAGAHWPVSGCFSVTHHEAAYTPVCVCVWKKLLNSAQSCWKDQYVHSEH